MSDPVAERRALVDSIVAENAAGANAPQAQARSLANSVINAPLPAVDPRTAVKPADVQRIAQAYTPADPPTHDGMAELARVTMQQQLLQQQLMAQQKDPLWKQALPYMAMGLATIGVFMFLRWCFGSPASSSAGFSPMTTEQQQVAEYMRRNVLSGNDEAMQALAVLAKQFKQ